MRKVCAAWLGLPVLLAVDAVLVQFRPLRFDDDVRARRQACVATDNGSACWKDRPLANAIRPSIGGEPCLRYDTVPRYVLGGAQTWRWALGTRRIGGHDAWAWTWELAVQGEHAGNADIRVWSLAIDTGYTQVDVAGRLRLALLLAPGVQLNASLDFSWRLSTGGTWRVDRLVQGPRRSSSDTELPHAQLERVHAGKDNRTIAGRPLGRPQAAECRVQQPDLRFVGWLPRRTPYYY